ncbi:MAG: TetR family transcriptional regulator [Syntrophobacteraceae bacterium]
MARRTKEESERTREKIIESAFDVFTSKGFTRTTLGDIAEAAGVTRGAIYWHFKDKVDLFMVLCDEIESSAGVRPDDLADSQVRTLQEVREKVLEYLSHFEENDSYGVLYELLRYRTEYTEELEPVRRMHQENQRKVLSRIKSIFGQLKSAGMIRENLDPENAALMLTAFVCGLIELWLLDKTAFSIIQTASSLLDEFLGGLA